MELLARNFLTGVVEQTNSPDQRDIEMRRLCFAELTRRGELWAIASTALKVYTLDEDGFYGKIIRCEAMAELAGRTRPGEGAAEDPETTNEPGRSRTADKPQNAAETPLPRPKTRNRPNRPHITPADFARRNTRKPNFTHYLPFVFSAWADELYIIN